MIDAMKLHEYIWQGIRKEVSADKIELYLPFFFGEGIDDPLCLTWDRKGVLSDGGRTISELKKRVGDIRPYLDTIDRILAQCGDCALVGGQAIVKEHFQTVIFQEEEYLAYLHGMNLMLKAITLISIMDTVPVTEKTEVKL